jgi:hypothetical protein
MKAPQASGLLDRLDAHSGHIILSLGVAMMAAYVASAIVMPKADGRIIIGDATHHFVQLRSAVFDRDFDFSNDYARIYGLDLQSAEGRAWVEERLSPTGLVRNFMPFGPALAWAPLYVTFSLALASLGALGLGPAPTGTERLLQLAPGLTGIAMATAAAWMAFGLAARFADRRSALWAAIGVWLGSHAIYYSLVSPAYSHAASMFFATAFFAHWISRRRRWTARDAAVSGALAGLAALMRWQDAIFLVVPIWECLRQRAPLASRVTAVGAAALGALVAFSPQMAVWQALYGRPFALPQGPSFLEWWSPNPVAVLFSDYHGLFTWSPILVLSIWGLVTLFKRERELIVPVAAVLLASWYVNAAVVDWWAGEAYGARRFLSLYPLFVVGLAIWIDGSAATSRAPRILTVAAFVVANGLLLVQYQAFMKGLRDLAPYPGGVVGFWLERFVVPWRLLTRWLG